MAISKNDLYKSRGIDPRAIATLNAKKDSRAQREDELKRKQVQREIDSLKSRLAVLDREMQRLSVSERRYKGDIAKTQQDFDKEQREMLQLSKELQNHSSKVEGLRNLLNSKKVTAGKSSGSASLGRQNIEKESQKLKSELLQIDREIDQLNGKKRRIVSEMSTLQTKMQMVTNLENKESSEIRRKQEEIDKIFQELKSEESVLERLKSRFAKEKRDVEQKEKELSAVRSRIQGASSVSSVESERVRIQQKIQELERKIR